MFLMGRDRDTFNRWEAGQSLAKNLIIASLSSPPDTADLLRPLKIHLTTNTGSAFKALMLGLPTEADIAAAIGKMLIRIWF